MSGTRPISERYMRTSRCCSSKSTSRSFFFFVFVGSRNFLFDADTGCRHHFQRFIITVGCRNGSAGGFAVLLLCHLILVRLAPPDKRIFHIDHPIPKSTKGIHPSSRSMSSSAFGMALSSSLMRDVALLAALLTRCFILVRKKP